ncbi:pathogenesis-related genes transcriptional activator [Volvox carteri f. nagariensis]|uniref:Pathogenesis-related genes transcriptional activator n=1 Tax=Volvox carteri f. nagariensis TaxID=3068 RepID=D8U3L4_VOLCA|nr:pathogenesis-related genes transcriptional activator [Volvox carteri f. nagariensis]EFJ45630.1 pathogenesis-related genes transcriptional activator [Volvox carteri f. nagariensis]|eukprot:XP_002953320.1 pathogenesis-related genes transcriptional activator [Volvox carteri f. nagariensis]
MAPRATPWLLASLSPSNFNINRKCSSTGRICVCKYWQGSGVHQVLQYCSTCSLSYPHHPAPIAHVPYVRDFARWEAHIWVKEIGRQVYLGGYEEEVHAAEAYDVAVLKCKGTKGVRTNFPISQYQGLLPSLKDIELEDLIMAVRRQSQGFSRGSSTYRGVTAHLSGRWEARIGIPGSKHIYLGLFESERDAAASYDRSLLRLRGSSAATNFPLSDYRRELAEYHSYQQVRSMVSSTGQL